MFEFIFSGAFLLDSIYYALPIIFASMAALISNKAGVLNINIEGSLSVAALTGALVSHFSGSWALGMACAVMAGILMSLLLSACVLWLRTDKILAGIALNTFAAGLSVLVLFSVLGVKGDSSSSPSVMIPVIQIPILSSTPVIGGLFSNISLLVYLAIICILLLWVLLNKTKLGLHIKAVGFNLEAARSVGINVKTTQVIALIICGTFAGLGGAFLSMVFLSYFSVGMVAGRGYIGLAAEAIGAGNPFLTILFALLFGAVDYFAIGAQSVLNTPYELLNTLPYLMTVIALVIYSLKKNGYFKMNKKQEPLLNEK